MLLALALLPWGCSQTLSEETSGDDVGAEDTSSSAGITVGTLDKNSNRPQDRAREKRPSNPDVTLRVEGDRGVRFSGLCIAGARQTVLTGEVPKQFTYDLDTQELSCRIQRRGSEQGSKSGSLRVVLLAGDTTRSVQQTSSTDGTIHVSYSSNS